jgi:hypothetical protein
MPSPVATAFLADLESRWGRLRKLPNSNSLFEVAGRVRVYLRYSKVHEARSTFFGIRKIDLLQLEGFPSFLCLFWDGQPAPLVIPYDDFREVFTNVDPARDGQYKVQVALGREGTDLRIARAGSFGVESYFGIDRLVNAVEARPSVRQIPDFTHRQVQTLLGAIGNHSGYGVWTPLADRWDLDWTMARQYPLVDSLPELGTLALRMIVQQIDVLWLDARRNTIAAAFEVEHSTPIYSGLLRFNDVHIDLKLPRAAVVAREERRSVFAKQVNRRTFQASGLSDVCVFYEYSDVYDWFLRQQASSIALPSTIANRKET